MSYKPSEGKREEFRKYLERTGVMDTLTKVLVSLYEEPEKPEDAQAFIRDQLAIQAGVETYAQLQEKIDELQAQLNELEAKLQSPNADEQPEGGETNQEAPEEHEEVVEGGGSVTEQPPPEPEPEPQASVEEAPPEEAPAE